MITNERLAFNCGLIIRGTFSPMSVRGQTARGFRLEPLSAKFLQLIASDAKLETVASGFGFTEGPMWDPAGFLYVSDETLNKIFLVYPDGHKAEVISLGDPDGNTFDRQHRLIDCASVLRASLRSLPKENTKCSLSAERYLGVECERQSARYNHHAGTAGEYDVGRQGLPHSVHHRDDLGLPF
jgi:hypothetical protein